MNRKFTQAFLLVCCLILIQQGYAQSTVTGKVTDTLGLPLIGVSISIKDDPKVGTRTNELGEYSINVSSSSFLIYSFVGFKKQEIPVNGINEINVILIEEESSLDEVVIVGFGTQKKVTLTGSIASIETKELKQSAVSNLTNALVGRLPGLFSRQPSGEPGQNAANIWLRGVSTFAGGNSPVIMVDGIQRDDFGMIDPNEVESITVLKDAAATAVFGVRGANGVIMVTTRRGVSTGKKPSINANIQQAIQTPTRLPEFLGSEDFLRLRRLGLINDGMYTDASRYTEEYISRFDQSLGWPEELEYKYLYPDVNWMEELLKNTSLRTQTNVNVTGGNDKVKYFVSGSYLMEDGLYKQESQTKYNVNVKENRFNFRSNIDLELSDWLTSELNLATIVSNRSYPDVNSGALFNAIQSTPSHWFPITNADGSIAEARGAQNPYAMLTQSGYGRRFRSYYQGTAGLKGNLAFLLHGLSARVRFTFDAQNNGGYRRPQEYWSFLYQGNGSYERVKSGADFLGYVVGGDYWQRNTNVEWYLNYDKKFRKHQISSMLLYRLLSRDIRAGDAIGALPRKEQGLVGRLTYSYDDKYIGEFNFGYNGSENFSRRKRFGFFPAFSIGWVMNKEEFLNDITWLEMLKLRGSAGQVGNPGDTRFAYQSRWNLNTAGYTFGVDYNRGYGGALEERFGNENVTWETSTQYNLGLDIITQRNIFGLTADLFYEKRTGIYTETERIVSSLFGARGNTLPFINAGAVENKGFELELTHRNSIGDEILFDLRAQYTFARNRILDYLEPPVSDRPWQARQNTRVNEYLYYISDGYFQNQEEVNVGAIQFGNPLLQPGDIRYIDHNTDGIIDVYDRVFIGKVSEPEHILGFSFTTSYKGFDIAALFQGALGRHVSLGSSAFFGLNNSFEQYVSDWKDNYWTPDNPTARYPRMMSQNNYNNTVASTHWLASGNYLRVKSAEIGYTIPTYLTQQMKVSKIRVYANGNNLLTWDQIKLFDPEENGPASGYPNMRVFNLGLSVNF